MKLTRFLTITFLAVVITVTAVHPPIVLADSCESSCQRSRDRCENSAYSKYLACKRYGEEFQCYYQYMSDLQDCARTYQDCVDAC